MGTNVGPDELNVSRYDTDVYDWGIRVTIPGHDELHQHIDDILASAFDRAARFQMLELGVGTGLTSERILRAFPVSTYTGIEYSENMLTGARKRLAPYDSTLICGDYTEGDLPTGNDLVVSVIGIHHQETDDDKKRLFGRIYDSLADEGHFVFGDLVTYRDPAEAALNEARHYHNLVTNVEDETLLREWAHHHKFLNCLAPLEDQVNWLREVGFRQVDVVYTKFNTALIHAVK